MKEGIRIRVLIAGGLLAPIVLAVSGYLFQRLIPEVPQEAIWNGQAFRLEIARTDAERSRGLGYRDTLCASCAMLFVFEKPGAYAFWMKGMRFPLDIVWISHGQAVFITRSLEPGSLIPVRPPFPADRVLEVNAGAAAGLSVGDRVLFR